MDGFPYFGKNVSEPQATIVVGLMTIIAAIVGVLLGSLLFGSRVRTMRDALDNIETRLRAHADVVGNTLEKVKSDLEGLQVELSNTRGDIQEAADAAEASAAVAGHENAVEEEVAELPALARLREDWEAIRVELEGRSRNSEIDGRTRAKYGRIDRRSYQSLIDVMLWDETLSEDDGAKFGTAWQLWTRHRNGRKTPSTDDVASMGILRRALVI